MGNRKCRKRGGKAGKEVRRDEKIRIKDYRIKGQQTVKKANREEGSDKLPLI